MTDYQEQLAECQANNKNLFASVGEGREGLWRPARRQCC
ncbi:alkylhydroperoxidase [Limosilactobacillus fermentum]|nr:alkylhydroperoxidase [Limosilactobacillus fermentum]